MAGIDADGQERLVIYTFYGFRIMQVHTPIGGYDSIVIFHLVPHILLLEDHIAKKPAGFTLSTDVSHPLKRFIRIFFFSGIVVLQI